MAIAFDATSSSAAQTGSSVTFSHTCTGTNLILIVGVTMASSVAKTMTSITYNGVSMTSVGAVDETTNQNRFSWLYYLIAPATGANNIVVTLSAAPTDFFSVAAASYTGVKQTGQPDASGTATSGSSVVSTISKAITTVADNSWLVGVSCNSAGGYNGTNTPDAGSVFRLSVYNRYLAGWELYFLDSNAAKTPAGSYSLGYSWTGITGKAQIIVASLAPHIVPPQLKSWNGIPIASIKSWNGIS